MAFHYKDLTGTAATLNGMLLVDKPSGMTSHDVVDKIRRTFKLPKVGHGGTLDPQATGLLIIMLGQGTKLSNRIMGSDKVYEGVMRLGVSTDSQDVDGNIVEERDFSGVTREDVEEEMRSLTGDIMQTPPMVSAVKKNGVPLYKLARKGKTVKREPRLIHVYNFSLLSFELPDASFRLRCSKGVYVRTLCHDIGEKLGCGAHLKELRRTESGQFNVEDAALLDDILKMDVQELRNIVIPVYKMASSG